MNSRHSGVSVPTTRRCRLISICTVVAALASSWPAEPLRAQEAVYADDDVKAAFIYHFATFVQWPETAQADEPFSFAILGADDIAGELEQYLPGRTIQGRPLSVRRIRSIDEAGNAAVLFIGARESARLSQLLDKIGSRPMLVVTDAPGALRDGSMINFQVVDQRVRFEISLAAAERAGLELSSRLLAAAMFVDTTSALSKPAAVLRARAWPVGEARNFWTASLRGGFADSAICTGGQSYCAGAS